MAAVQAQTPSPAIRMSLGAVLRAGARARASAAAARQSSRSALVISGDAGQRRFCESLLQTMDICVAVACDARQAGIALRERSYGMIIVDTAVVDAIALAELLREAVSSAGKPPRLYFVTERGRPTPIGRPLGRVIERPLRALDLVQAAQRLA